MSVVSWQPKNTWFGWGSKSRGHVICISPVRVLPAERAAFSCLSISVSGTYRTLASSSSRHVGLEIPTGELVCAAVNPEVM